MQVPCPSRSPRSGYACCLPDDRVAHHRGHATAKLVGGNRMGWSVVQDDLARWAGVAWAPDPEPDVMGKLIAEGRYEVRADEE